MNWPVPCDGVPSVVTIGKFDGVHLGHQAVIERLKSLSNGRRVVAVTFDRHPRSVFDPEHTPSPLLSLDQKREALLDAGADSVVVLPFTEEFRALSPDQFISDILVEGLSAQLVLVGEDFRFGRAGLGDVDTLRAAAGTYGFSVETVMDICAEDTGDRISTSIIRDALSIGDVSTAARLLGRPHQVRGEVVHGHQRGRELGFPTANLAENAEGYVPMSGVYAGILEFDGRRFVAGISVGTNPTFHDVTRNQVEAHALDATFDAYGHVASIGFTHRLRDSIAFNSLDELIAAMAQDVEDIRQLVARGQLSAT